jgi:hypothetical protein
MMSDESNKPSSCPAPAQPHQSNLAVVELQPAEPVADYRVAWKGLLYYLHSNHPHVGLWPNVAVSRFDGGWVVRPRERQVYGRNRSYMLF